MKSKQEPSGGRESGEQPMSAARIRSCLSLSTQKVRDGLARPSEYRRTRRIKDLSICGWFMASLPALNHKVHLFVVLSCAWGTDAS